VDPEKQLLYFCDAVQEPGLLHEKVLGTSSLFLASAVEFADSTRAEVVVYGGLQEGRNCGRNNQYLTVFLVILDRKLLNATSGNPSSKSDLM